MRPVEAARRAVVATNRWPGFGTLYRRAYDLGLAFSARRLGSVPGVLAVLLRANDDDRTWTPGLSDYDLGVLVERLDGPRALPLLDALWRRYRSTKRLVPQLGEMEVLSVDEFADTLAFGPAPTAAIKRAYPLRVRPGRPEVERVLERRARPAGEPELLLDALSRFSRFAYPAWLDEPGDGGAPPRPRTAHLLGNVAKRLARLGEPAAAAPRATALERTADVLRSLARACGRFAPGGVEPGGVVDAGEAPVPAELLAPLYSFCAGILRAAAVGRCSAVAWISYLSTDRLNLVFVVPDEVAPAELGRLLVALKSERRASERLLESAAGDRRGAPRAEPPPHPTVSSESMWRAWRELAPLEGAAVAARGRTLVGETGRVHAVPSRTALRRGAEVQYAALLPLKNNWRVHGGRPPAESYVPLVDHARGAATAATGRVRTVPAALALGSTAEGWRLADEALRELRAVLAG